MSYLTSFFKHVSHLAVVGQFVARDSWFSCRQIYADQVILVQNLFCNRAYWSRYFMVIKFKNSKYFCEIVIIVINK